MKLIVIRVLLVLLIVAICGFYIYDLVVNDTEPTKNLFRTLSIVFLGLGGLVRTYTPKSRRSLSFYEEQYADIVKGAFLNCQPAKKKLLCAARFYDEGNYQKSSKYLSQLREKCKTKEDFYAVYLFAGLCFTDMGLYDLAQNAYNSLIHADIANSRVFSNLGHVQIRMGEYQKALQNYNHALEYDKNNAYAYNNIAQAHFDMHNFDEAIPNALKALEINPKMYQASTLLAIVYALTGDAANQEKYSHMAINSGRNPQELKEAIEYFRAAQATQEPEPSEE